MTDNTVTQTPPLLDHWLVAKQWRYALPSAFDFAVRAARDALPARHGLSPRPCGSPGEVVHLSTVWDARKNHSPIIKVFVSNLMADDSRPFFYGEGGERQRAG
ncbi:hypothetical protein MRO89_21135 [Dickeya dianthicola]|uniref:hypothetical protein n=1 Tax=Dickeya dianthicola TaxID=204039 RepID=UPI001F6156B4|nr:hypothetical protein [Dickeya dianthicola]MCI4188431.1 hypothetical protein [Dickeya dianthicola]